MDDLSSLQWNAPPASKQPPASASTTASSFPALRPTPSPFASGRNTPLGSTSTPGGFKPPATSTSNPKPAADTASSFSNLVNFGSAKSTANLTLRERADLLEAEKRRKEEERRKQAQASFGDGRFLDTLGSGHGTPRTASPGLGITPPPQHAPCSTLGNGNKKDDDADLFAAFSASTKVDNASHFPPPAEARKDSPAAAPGLNLSNPQAWNVPVSGGTGGSLIGDDDDDPFGLSQFKGKASASAPAPPPPEEEEDDLLGDLGRPVEEVRRKQPAPQPKAQAPSFSRTPEPGKAIEDSSDDSEPEERPPSNDPFDKAVAQLVDYGFTPENARRGLTESGAGLNVQAAVNWLLDDAHRQAKEKAKGGKGPSEPPASRGPERASSQLRNGGPSWMREAEGARSRDNRSPASSDADFTKTAAAVGTSLLKTANSFWKQGQKKVQKAVQEFQQEGGDSNQPKWMRSAQQDFGADEKRRPDVTDEAAMLESGMRPGRRPGVGGSDSRPSSNATSRDQSPAFPTRPGQGSSTPKWQQANHSSGLDPRSRLSKQAVEEQSAQAYVSPARRKKTTPQPPPEAEPDLLFGSSEPSKPSKPQPQTSLPSRSAQPSPAPRPTPRASPAPRPAPTPRPQRSIPSVSAIALQSSTKHRVDGTAHFKRGDYAAAHACYTSSLTCIPPTHPLTILLLCNRALTALKTGEPRQAVEDADKALEIIGPAKGEGEHVELHGGDNEKRDMRELYGKALTRKAEALEQMEKWSDAASVWQLAIESGHGGATATAGRQRCQKALAPKPAARPPPARAAPPRRPTPAASQKSSEAVQRLREANKAAEKEGNEKIELIDKVDARVAAWRDGKRDNLRALLGSMENVLWEGSGWKKVGLHELVMTNKVKIIYMKAIAKTHPDKLPQDASTEVRMIAGTVFSTLNEAWDKFKAENGL
ncbi:hypothetical protein QBC34DRAFT_319360 [Podospora aff. communis PSN243]|uniref:UBA domain-containing protein n=1 Tax=Podospora aff. communis PSN243 TaxID=3040156 RepID=A0AAV9H2F7_9PEZI|nr:hypothetical protein QBC34DRAFT_319360 [Podospora aff. communis PSN243]